MAMRRAKKENSSQDEEARDAIFCPTRLVRPGWFLLSPSAIFLVAAGNFMLVPLAIRCSNSFTLSLTTPLFIAFRTLCEILHREFKVMGDTSMNRFRNE